MQPINFDWHWTRKNMATYALFIVTAMTWLTQVMTYGSKVGTFVALWNFGAFFAPFMQTDPTQLFRLLTPVFVHVSWLHFLGNMFTLLFIGRIIEEIVGSWRFLAIYLLSSVFACALLFYTGAGLTAGASAALFGLFGAIAMLGFFTGSPQLKEIGKSFAVLIFINLVLNLFTPGVSVLGHIGGAVGGGLLAAIFPPKLFSKWIPTWVKVMSGLTFIVLLLFFIAAPLIN